MKRSYLTLISSTEKGETNTPKYELKFTKDFVSEDSEVKGTLRTSPIFFVNDDFKLSEFNLKKIILLYSLNPYNIITEFNRLLSKSGIELVLTHGLSSVLIFLRY
ncbi:MAG: hypothetical protein LUH15_08100 [Tannerellaceae bacterium]|nr:hypothetical protein [Tannerellaceae bacterium]